MDESLRVSLSLSQSSAPANRRPAALLPNLQSQFLSPAPDNGSATFATTTLPPPQKNKKESPLPAKKSSQSCRSAPAPASSKPSGPFSASSAPRALRLRASSRASRSYGTAPSGPRRCISGTSCPLSRQLVSLLPCQPLLGVVVWVLCTRHARQWPASTHTRRLTTRLPRSRKPSTMLTTWTSGLPS